VPLKKSLSHVQYTGLWFNIYEKKLNVPCLISMKKIKVLPNSAKKTINFAWSLTTEQPVLRARSSQNVHLLTYPVKENIQDVI
jgi:hypothetical protein